MSIRVDSDGLRVDGVLYAEVRNLTVEHGPSPTHVRVEFVDGVPLDDAVEAAYAIAGQFGHTPVARSIAVDVKP